MMITEDQQEMWDALKHRTFQEQLEDSCRLGEPSTQLLASFVAIANGVASRLQFINYEYSNEVVNDAIVQMIASWRRADSTEGSHSGYKFFVVIAFAAFDRHVESENMFRRIKTNLAEVTNLEQLNNFAEQIGYK
jgi:hypothetical protein